jgi:chloramphenicol-sensitive protein RarD
MGYYFLGERLDKLTKIALLFALAAVLLKGTSLSNFPWIAISMATTFALYAIIRKQLPVKSDTGTLIETIMLAPIAVIYFGWRAQNGAVLFFGADLMGLMLAVFCGLFTIIPLYLFHNGNKMLPLAIAGLIFYLNPTSQLIISIMLGEPFSFIDISVFVLIWTGLLIQFSPMFFKSQ